MARSVGQSSHRSMVSSPTRMNVRTAARPGPARWGMHSIVSLNRYGVENGKPSNLFAAHRRVNETNTENCSISPKIYKQAPSLPSLPPLSPRLSKKSRHIYWEGQVYGCACAHGNLSVNKTAPRTHIFRYSFSVTWRPLCFILICKISFQASRAHIIMG